MTGKHQPSPQRVIVLSGEHVDDEILILEEVARLTRTPLNTVRFWVRTGRLRSFRPGRRRLVWRSDLAEFLEQSRGRKSTSLP